MSELTEYELERQANIERNRALLESLDIQAVTTTLVSKKKEEKKKAKPVQPAKRVKVVDIAEPRRQSARLRRATVDPNESPSKKRKRLEEDQQLRRVLEEERFVAEEQARLAKRPRHGDLDLVELAKTAAMEDDERNALSLTLQQLAQESHPRRAAGHDDFVYEEEKEEKHEVDDLRTRLKGMKVCSRAKVCENRIYSAAYHPEKSKDLIFFGDKHGQLGIWDARAATDEVKDEDDEIDIDTREGGKHWKLQPHWPATSKSSMSAIRFDPRDAQRIFTSSYDCTIRSTSFESGKSLEIFATDGMLISSFDVPPEGQEMWISDAEGGVSHLDLREDKTKARRWILSPNKIGCVSVNPTHPEKLLCSSNNRTLKIWDARKLNAMPFSSLQNDVSPATYDSETVEEYMETPAGKESTVGLWAHGKSVSSAYWDPRGRSIVSTCYDDQLRVWDLGNMLAKEGALPSFRPIAHISHSTQTGRWVTVLKAQWSPNPDIYPHFTVGNMNHSLDIFTCKGELVCRLEDRERVSAVQAVTCSHPGIAERAASGNASGRCVLWAPADL